jgi:hypothetical protein
MQRPIQTRVGGRRLAQIATGTALVAVGLLVAGCSGAKQSSSVPFEQPTQPTAEERRRMEEAMKKVPGVGAPQPRPAPSAPR